MKTLTISEVNSAIMHQSWTNDQLMSMAMAIKYARNELTRKTRWSLAVGASVKFTHTRTGRVHIGTVEKINIKKVIVKEGQTRWTVPAAMLEAA